MRAAVLSRMGLNLHLSDIFAKARAALGEKHHPLAQPAMGRASPREASAVRRLSGNLVHLRGQRTQAGVQRFEEPLSR
jgi:hypothetical protein